MTLNNPAIGSVPGPANCTSGDCPKRDECARFAGSNANIPDPKDFYGFCVPFDFIYFLPKR